jgi:hypothetical protein
MTTLLPAPAVPAVAVSFESAVAIPTEPAAVPVPVEPAPAP